MPSPSATDRHPRFRYVLTCRENSIYLLATGAPAYKAWRGCRGRAAKTSVQGLPFPPGESMPYRIPCSYCQPYSGLFSGTREVDLGLIASARFRVGSNGDGTVAQIP